MEPSLLAWARTFLDDAESLAAFADGSVLLCVAQDTMEDFSSLNVPQDLCGLLRCLEHAYEVRVGRWRRHCPRWPSSTPPPLPPSHLFPHLSPSCTPCAALLA